MPDRPYTDDDLRTEAARQHATLTEDPDFMGVGEQMDDTLVDSTVVEPDRDDTGSTWAELLDPDGDGTSAYAEAQRKIHDLIQGAADVSEWAINLGADGLVPSDEHQLTLDGDGKPIVRIHFAFEPDMDDLMKNALVTGLAQAVAEAL